MMKIKAGTIVFVLFFLSIALHASPLDSIGVTKINNKIHVKYMVSPGETIYGISTKFGVAVSDLMELNPELENGLKVGQVINIPYNPEAIKATKKDDNLVVHKVQPGETFYSLSRKYNVSVEELMKMNNITLKAGQEIVVGYKDQATTANVVKPTAVEKPKEVEVEKVEVTKEQPVAKKEVPATPKEEPKTVVAEKTVAKPVETTSNTHTTVNTNTTSVALEASKPAETKTVAAPATSSEQYAFDPTREQLLIIPFDPYLYFSDADDEIAAKSNIPRTKVRQVFRKRLNAMLDAPNYETIHLLGGKAKDSISDLNKIYSMVTYNYQQVKASPYYKEPEIAKPVEKKGNKNWLDKQKTKLATLTSGEESVPSKYEVPTDNGSYFGVIVKNQEFFNYFNNKYSVDYYVFVSQFEVKTNYEHCLDRAAQNYDRTFTTHYSIFDKNGKQIAGNKFKTHYNSNSNYVYTIVADNVEKIANRILSDLPPAGQQ